VFNKIIERNTTIPVKKSQIYSTAADGQTSVEIHVLQGEREMASANKTLGRFVLDGIPPAMRGVPQIEVTFDIDANGIVNVSAKDKGTGKEQKITITASTNMSQEEIDAAIKEAEMHAAEDKQMKENVETRNNAENLIFQTEKTLNDSGDKLTEEDKAPVRSAIEKLRETLKTEDYAQIKNDTNDLTSALYKISEKLYAGENPQDGQNPGANPGGDEFYDADYTDTSDK